MTGILGRIRQQKSGTVYRSLVKSLYADIQVLLMGHFATFLGVALTAYAADSKTLWVLSVLFLVIGAFRAFNSRAFEKVVAQQEFGNAIARKWERKFTVWSVINAGMLGGWFLYTFTLNDKFSQMTSLAVILGNMIGICCRSYAFERLVNYQTAAILGSVVVGLFLQGGYYSLFAILLMPYALSVRKFATDLRVRLLGNIYQRREAENTANQFDTALDAVPQGICMFNGSGSLEVVNQNVLDLMQRSDVQLLGTNVAQLITLLAQITGIPKDDEALLMNWVTAQKSDSITHVFPMTAGNVKNMKFRASKMPNGGMIVTFEDITREVLAANKIEEMRRFDLLTGLLNRGQFENHLTQQLQIMTDRDNCALLLANLDGFKRINEVLGHQFGDQLLIAATARLKNVSEEFGVCARYGGDEFAVFLKGADSADVATALSDTIIAIMSRPFDIGGRSVQLGCTIGITIVEGRFDDHQNLLKQADFALEAAKSDCRGEWRVFNEEMRERAEDRRELEADMKTALQQEQFEAFFQPLVSVKEGRVSVCEALIRWKHPVKGYVPPFHFIPIAEETGLISQIGLWMLRESCRACATWPNGTRVAVNLSPLQFNDGDIVETVQDVLNETGLDPSRLELEITESLMLDHMSDVIAKLNQFKRMGVHISLDDFGTGYSSLSYMNSLPLNKVKIDRSFVIDIQPNTKSMTLVQAIAGLGHQLGLKVVVEGVETTDELGVLLSNALIDEIQGYLFSKPVDKHTIYRELQSDSELYRKISDTFSPVKADVA